MPPALYTMGQPVEDEEQRRRREALEALARGESPTPVKQTITTDPVTGEQKMKIEGSVQDLSAVNPMTPTVTGPAVPGMMDQTGPTQDEIMRDQAMAQLGGITPVEPAQMPTMAQPEPEPQVQPAPAMAQPEPQPAPAAPVPPTQLAAAPTQTRTDATQAAPATTEQPRVPFGAPIPSPSDQQYEAQGIQEGPTGRMLQGQIQPRAQTNMERLLAAQGNPDELQKLNVTGNLTQEEKQLANIIIRDRLSGEQQKQAATRQANEVFTSGDPNKINRALRSKDGNWLKAIMLGAFGASDMAREELNKLGYGGQYRTVMLGDQQAYIKTTEKGQPLEGMFLSGPKAGQPLTEQELMGQAGTGQDMEYVGGTFVNDITGQTGRWATNKKTGQQLIMTDKGPVATTGFRPQGVEGSLYDRYQKLEQDAKFNFRKQSAGQNLRDHSLLNQNRINAGLPALTLAQRGLNNDGTLIGQTSATADAPGARMGGSPASTEPPRVDDRGAAEPMPREDGVNSSLPRNVDANPNKTSKVSGPTGQDLAAQGKAKEANLEAFVKYKNDDLLPKAEKAGNLSSIRRQQINGEFGILNRPEVAGLLSGTGTAAREVQNIFRDIVAGNYDKVENMSARISSISQPQAVKDALYAQLQFQREVTPNIIREVAPVGAITDFEQRMAKDAGIDITRTPLYPALYNLTRSQFSSDMAQYKAHFAAQNPQLTTRETFDREWTKEKTRMEDINRRIIQDRTAYMKSNGNSNAAILESFKDSHFPVPRWDPGSRNWIFDGFSKRALKPRLQDFER